MRRVAGRFVFWGLLGACASAAPATHYYQLALSQPARSEAAGADVVLAIEPLAVDAAYATDRIVYRRNPYRLDYYHYHRWSAPPALQLSDYLRQAFEATGRFARVTSDPTEAQTTATLRGRILALEEVDVTETRWVGRVRLELALFDPRSEQVLWSRAFLEEEPLGEQSPEGLARALSMALARIVERSSGPILAAAVAQARRGDGKPDDCGAARAR